MTKRERIQHLKQLFNDLVAKEEEIYNFIKEVEENSAGMYVFQRDVDKVIIDYIEECTLNLIINSEDEKVVVPAAKLLEKLHEERRLRVERRENVKITNSISIIYQESHG